MSSTEYRPKKINPNGRRGQTNIGTYVILALALGSMVFFGVCSSPQGNNQKLGNIAARVGSEEINQNEFSRSYRRLSDQMNKQGQDQSEIGKKVLDRLIQNRVIYLEAKKLSLAATRDEITTYIANNFLDKEGKYSEDLYKRNLSQGRFSEVEFFETLRRELTVERFYNFFQKTSFVSTNQLRFQEALSKSRQNADYLKFDYKKWDYQVSDADMKEFSSKPDFKEKIKDYYNRNNSKFNEPEKIKARHILIKFDGKKKGDKEKSKKRADSILKKLRKKGTSFINIAKKETDEPGGKKKGGDLGIFNRATMVKEFSETAFALNEGEISEVVETKFGFHIIKLEKKFAAKNTTIEQATQEIASKLIKRQKAPEQVKAVAIKVLNKLKAGDKSVSKLLNKHKLKWQETGDVALTLSYVQGLGQGAGKVLASLKNPGDLYEKLFANKDNFYIIKLKKRKIVSPKSIKNKDLEQKRQMASYSQYLNFIRFIASAREKLEESDDIYRNPNYEKIGTETAQD